MATAQGPQILGIGRLKLALPLLSGVKLKCDHHTLRPYPEHDDTGSVEGVVDFKEVPSNRGNGKVQKWLVKCRGHQEWTWETRDSFVHHVCDPWWAYNAKHGDSVPLCPPGPPCHHQVPYIHYVSPTLNTCHLYSRHVTDDISTQCPLHLGPPPYRSGP